MERINRPSAEQSTSGRGEYSQAIEVVKKMRDGLETDRSGALRWSTPA